MTYRALPFAFKPTMIGQRFTTANSPRRAQMYGDYRPQLALLARPPFAKPALRERTEVSLFSSERASLGVLQEELVRSGRDSR
jgi:hypothetical protein